MPEKKDDEIMAEYLLKGGKMLEKSCPVCGCPLFEYKKKTFCVVCAEKDAAAKLAKTTKAPSAPAAADPHSHNHAIGCSCGGDHNAEPCSCEEEEGGMLAEEIAMTVHALCERINNEKDPNHILTLMTAVKTGAEALEILCRL
ncbi:autoantigen p27 domain-containing protein [Methanoregula sp.]|uniref:autoantigen p27 domain-containing protein n=1 Tax=Methanoregula sp. TaxID=2052170 RepID=UPI002CC2EFCD|nr:autoantigen p27 domain-containing protein [Methanoregula sp.]HVP96349.1 autoantigen p27 domain-containing protein [Methanoregula sp.]